MTSTMPPLNLIFQHRVIRFLTFRKNFLDKWGDKNNNNVSVGRRLTSLHRPHSYSPNRSLSLRDCRLLPRPSLHSLFGPRSPPLRYSFSVMSTPQASSDSNQSPTKRVRVVVKGRVQGVFYRNWTIENANQLGLKGWVRNRRDGSVEALFSGNSDAVREIEQRCRRGPPDAVVTGLEVFPSNEEPGNGFERKPTV